MKKGADIETCSDEKVVAVIVTDGDPTEQARQRLIAQRPIVVIGDVTSPIDVEWEVERRFFPTQA